MCVRVCVYARIALEMCNILERRVVVAFVFGIIAWNMDQAFLPETILWDRFSPLFPGIAILKVFLRKM